MLKKRKIPSELKQDLRKWRNTPHSWNGRINIILMLIFSKLIYIFDAIPTKFPAFSFFGLYFFFVEIENLTLVFSWKTEVQQ